MNKIAEIAPSEYKPVYIDSEGFAYAPYWVNGIGTKVIPFQGGHKFVEGSGGLYNVLLRKASGEVYVHNNNSTILKFLQYRSDGASFKAQNVLCYLRTYIAVDLEGSIYAMGYNSFKWFGTDSNKILDRWTLIPGQPAGVKFKAIAKGGGTGSGYLIALTEDGQVYTVWDNSTKWVKKDLPGAVSRIYGSYNNFYIVLIDGRPFGWGQGKYLTGVAGYISTYVNLSPHWDIGEKKIIDLAVNDNTIHYILDDNSLWGMGDNAQGEVGLGWELVNRKELYKGSWYVWNWLNATHPSYQQIAFVPKPQRIRENKLFSRVWSGNYFAYYKFAQEVGTGAIYGWGRNKGAVLPIPLGASNEADYPNFADVLSPREMDVFGNVVPLPSPFVPGKVYAGIDQSIDSSSTTLIGSATASRTQSFTYTIVGYQWSKVSGPNCTIESPNSLTTRVSGMTNGTYTFELKTIDSNGATAADTVNITVAIINKTPIVNVGSDQLVVGRCTTVSAEARDEDGVITSTSWQKLSGPEGDVIMNPLSLITDISFTNSGIYIYRITVTDNKGESSFDDITVRVIFNEPNEVIVTHQCEQ